MKVYARQVNPEYQESTLFLGEGFFPVNIAVCGNRNYKERMPDTFRKVRNVLDAGELDEVLHDFAEGDVDPVFQYETEAEAVADYLPPEGRKEYTAEEVANLVEYVRAYADARSRAEEVKNLLLTLGIVTGTRWATKTLQGDCQGDWQEAFFPAEEWTQKALAEFEAAYFNTGTEWLVEEFTDEDEQPNDPADIAGWSIYLTTTDDDKTRAKIADAAGCMPEEVTLYRWTGVRKIDVYEKI